MGFEVFNRHLLNLIDTGLKTGYKIKKPVVTGFSGGYGLVRDLDVKFAINFDNCKFDTQNFSYRRLLFDLK